MTRTLVLTAAIGVALAPAASAGQIKGLFPLSMEKTAEAVVPQFERSSGHTVTIAYSTAGAVATKVRNGDAADVAISAASAIDALAREGKIAAGSALPLARVGIGMLVRKGAAKPDIGTVDQFKAALLAARTIAYTDPALGGPAGIYVDKLMEQLGIGGEMDRKTKLAGPGAAVSTAVVNGEADIGFIMINEIVADPRVELVGPLPAALQSYTVFAAGVVAASAQPQPARDLVTLLAAPATLVVMKRLGFEAP